MPTMYKIQKSFGEIMHLLPNALIEYQQISSSFESKTIKAKKIVEIKKKYGFSPILENFKQYLPVIVQLPFHLTFYPAIACMYPSYINWKYGGMDWCKDLSIPDPYYITPFFLTFSCFASLALFANNFKQTKINPQLIFGIGGIAAFLCVPLFGSFVSAGSMIYISANSWSFVLQNYLMNNSKFRNIIGLKPISVYNEARSNIARISVEIKRTAKGKSSSADENMEQRVQAIEGKRKGRRALPRL